MHLFVHGHGHGRRAPWAVWLALAVLLQARPASADIRIDINGVEGGLRQNVLALLSLQRYRERDRIEPDAVQRLYNRIDDEVRTALRPFGYYEPRITSSIQGPDKDRRWRVQINIDPGVPVLIDTVNVTLSGPGADEPVFTRLRDSPQLRAGERLNHAAYEQLKGGLERAAATYGYLDARLLRNELQVNLATHKADIFLELQTGERYRFGATTVEQHAVHEDVVRRFLRYKEGDPYNALLLLRTQFALDDSLYYSTVEVDAGERDRVQHTVPISIRASNARRGYSVGAGYGTDTGLRGTASWTVPRVNSYGHHFRVEAQISQIQQTFDARYTVPVGDPAVEKGSLDFIGQESEYGDYVTTNSVAFVPAVTQVLGTWQRILSVTAAHTVTDVDVNINNQEIQLARKIDNLILPGIVFASVPEGYLGESLFSRGLYVQLLGSGTALGANANFLRLDVQGQRVVDLATRWHLLLRTELGASTVKDTADLPGQYRFFAGGDRSVRGFAFDELGPVSVLTQSNPNLRYYGVPFPVKIGGQYLATGTIELERDLPRNFGVAFFVDGGNALDHLDDPLAWSTGIGFRLRLPVITVGIDVAQPLRAPGFSSLPGPRLELNISPRL
jgi:translocation and assembly module TamA